MAKDYAGDIDRAKARVRETNYTDRDAWAAQWEADRRWAKSTGGPWAELLDLGRQWDAGAPLPHVVSGNGTCVLVCRASEPDPSWDGTSVKVVSPSDPALSALLIYTFRGFHSIKFGGPNDEVMHGHPLSGRGLVQYGAHVIHESPWLAEEEQINSVHPHHNAEGYRRLRHYLFAFHDETFEALARDVEVRLVASTMADQLHEAVRQMTSNAADG